MKRTMVEKNGESSVRRPQRLTLRPYDGDNFSIPKVGVLASFELIVAFVSKGMFASRSFEQLNRGCSYLSDGLG